MKRKETAKFNMVCGINYFFKEKMYLTDEITRLKEDVTLLEEYKESIYKQMQVHITSIGGMAIKRGQLRKEIVGLALNINRLTVAHCKVKNDLVMLKAVRCSLSDLRRATDVVLIRRCRLIIQNAVRNKKQLKSFGLKEDMLENLNLLLTKLKQMTPAYEAARSGKTAAHRQMRKLLQEACDLLKYNVDAMMAILKEKFTDEANIYVYLRKVICHGRKRKAYGGRFKDKLTGKMLEDVQMSVVDTAEKLVNDFANKVTVVIEKAGYKKVVLKDVDMLLLNELACEMEPETEQVAVGDGFKCF